MAKHAPWEAKPSNGIWFLHNSRGDVLARFTIGSQAEAKLAAIAPELLDALEAVLLDAQTGNADLSDTTGHRVRAALAKATGHE